MISPRAGLIDMCSTDWNNNGLQKNQDQNQLYYIIKITCNFFWLSHYGTGFMLSLVVQQSSETSTNQLDIVIRFNDRFLILMVDADS